MNAEQHLQVALKYIDRIVERPDDEDRVETLVTRLSDAAAAAEHVAQAQALDPNAIYRDPKTEKVYTINGLAGVSLLFEGSTYIRYGHDTDQMKKGIAALHKALKYLPDSVSAYIDLSVGYQRIKEYKLSEQYAQKAVDIEPMNMRARELVDQKPLFPQAEKPFKRTIFDDITDYFSWRSILGVISIVAGIFCLASPFAPSSILFFAIGAGLIYWGRVE